MRISRKIWLAITLITPLIAVLVIQRTISAGMSASYAGRPVDIATYVGGLIGAVLLVFVAICAGIMAGLTKK